MPRAQVGKLEQALAQAHATIAQQTQEMALLGRRQALADWTSFADTRKRLWSSLVRSWLPHNLLKHKYLQGSVWVLSKVGQWTSDIWWS